MSDIAVSELSRELRDAIADLETKGKLEATGIVTRVGDGVAWIHGLRNAGYSEVLQIETKNGIVEAFALNLMEDEIGAVILGDDTNVRAGAKVRLTGRILEVPVGPVLAQHELHHVHERVASFQRVGALDGAPRGVLRRERRGRRHE